MSDEIWADSRGEQADPAPQKMHDVTHLMRSIQRGIRELDTQRASGDVVAQVLDWLRDLPPNTQASELAALGRQYAHWMGENQVVSDALWFQVAEISAWLAIHGDEASLRAFATTTLRTTAMPNKEAFCDRQRQVRFSIQLFDSLCGAVISRLTAHTAPLVVEIFVSWLVRVMGDYEFIFLRHVASPLAAHIQQKLRVLPNVLADAVRAFVESRVTRSWQTQAPSIASASILLAHSTQAPVLRSVQALVTENIQSDGAVFPHVHHALAVLAAPLQAAPLAVVSSPLVHQFILLRVVHLPLLSPRLVINQDEYRQLCERYQESLYRTQVSEREVDISLRMIDAATDEIQTAMTADPIVASSILQSMRSRSETELFRPSLIAAQEQFEQQCGSSDQRFPVLEFLAHVYDAASITLQALSQSPSTSVVIECCSTLSRLEFAREICATPQRNDLMVRLTQRMEDLIETAPDATLSALTTSILSRSRRDPSLASQDLDVVFGWACLAVGLIVQRKLRVVLFQAGDAARRDAFAVVFAGIYHGLEPLSSFAHRFLTFTLSSLGQFVSVYEMFPFYLQETLRRFPSDATKQQAANVLGTVFGALYYTNPSPALTDEEKRIEATAAETRHAMILWALRQTSQRTKALLPVDGGDDSNAASNDGLYMAELFFEVAKMAPVDLLPTVAREMEALVDHSAKVSHKMLDEVKTRVFNAISVNCEAEKRAWLAAWFLELSAAYPTSAVTVSADDVAADAAEAAKAQPPQSVSRL